MLSSIEYLAQISKQLRENNVSAEMQTLILDTVTGYGLARYADGFSDGEKAAISRGKGTVKS